MEHKGCKYPYDYRVQGKNTSHKVQPRFPKVQLQNKYKFTKPKTVVDPLSLYKVTISQDLKEEKQGIVPLNAIV